MIVRIPTGIIPTGTPRLGNYVGVIYPATFVSRRNDADSFYFPADYRTSIKCDDPARIRRSRLEIVATWPAGGLDVERATSCWQLDIPETPELAWLLICVSAEGLLNRAHTCKTAVDRNVEAGEDPDAGVIIGLYSYPMLMAMDTLMLNAHKIPVDRNQMQHVEMTRNVGQRFNHLFGNGRESSVLLETATEEDVATLPGLDGCEVSKSYDSTVPLFNPSRQLKDTIARIVTNSHAPSESKDPDNSHLFFPYSIFASAEQVAVFRQELLGGLIQGEAKQRLFQLLDSELGEARERYQVLVTKSDDVEDILLAGVAKVRRIATPFIARSHEAVGLRPLREPLKNAKSGEKKAARAAHLVNLRDGDGSFRFHPLDAAGKQLLLSRAFTDGRAAGAASKCLLADETADLRAEGNTFGLWLDDETVAQSLVPVDAAVRNAAIERTREALAPQEQASPVHPQRMTDYQEMGSSLK